MPSARADEQAHIDAGLFLGGNYFSEQFELGNAYFDEQVPGSAFLVGVRGAYSLLRLAPDSDLAPLLSVELEAKLALSSTGEAPERMRSSYFAPVLGWRAQAVLDLWSEHRLHPLVVAGIGGETVFSSSPFVASGDSDAAMHWGVGARYEMTPRYGIRGDLRHGVTAGRTDLASSTLEAHVGFYYRFSVGSKEPIIDPVEELIGLEPEPEPEPAPEPADRDGDGLPDDIDQCPEEAEIVNEIDDEDGCPEVDSDGDGLLGTRDECPDAAEDLEGFQDEDGCPDPDNDEDGMPDVSDECPNQPESDNGFEDEDGCPDELPEQVASYLGVIEGIRFASGSARIQDDDSRRLLDAAAAILLEYPELRIRISGHTDDRGRTRRNLELSRARADSVRWYLIDAGIEHERIVTMGYGPERPIADNATAEGRAKNRRIEFDLLRPPASAPRRSAGAPADASDDGVAEPGETDTSSDGGGAPATGEPNDAPTEPAPAEPQEAPGESDAGEPQPTPSEPGLTAPQNPPAGLASELGQADEGTAEDALSHRGPGPSAPPAESDDPLAYR